jgi:hypothetical protein
MNSKMRSSHVTDWLHGERFMKCRAAWEDCPTHPTPTGEDLPAMWSPGTDSASHMSMRISCAVSTVCSLNHVESHIHSRAVAALSSVQPVHTVIIDSPSPAFVRYPSPAFLRIPWRYYILGCICVHKSATPLIADPDWGILRKISKLS